MWARKETRFCVAEDGVTETEEYTEVNDSWYNILLEGVGGILFCTVCCVVLAVSLPFMVGKAAYQQYRYQNTPVPPKKVRDRCGW